MKIFVYGTLKRGFGNNRLLTEAKYLGKAVTVKPFVMVGWGVPFVWPDENGKPIHGEVFDIGDPKSNRFAKERLARLDSLESNGSVYERKVHTVRMIENAQGIRPLPRDAGEEHEAWIYEGMEFVQRQQSEFKREDNERFLNGAGCYEWGQGRAMP